MNKNFLSIPKILFRDIKWHIFYEQELIMIFKVHIRFISTLKSIEIDYFRVRKIFIVDRSNIQIIIQLRSKIDRNVFPI